MPDLSRIVQQFGATLTKQDGSTIIGTLKPAQDVRATFHGVFAPRSMLIVSANQNVQEGDAVTDPEGNTYLCGAWGNSFFWGSIVALRFVLYYAPHVLAWQRNVTTIEPVSGLATATGLRTLGAVPALKEPLAQVKDAGGSKVQSYRLMVAVPLMLEDWLDGQRVQRVENAGGLYYAETL